MRWHRFSLRARLILLGSLGLAAGLTVGGVVLVGVLNLALHRTVDDAARQTAQGVADIINEQGTPPNPVPVSDVDAIVQVIDSQSRVRTASIGADRLSPIVDGEELARVRAGKPLTIDGGYLGASGSLRVVALRAGSSDDPLTVLVARSTSGIAESVRAVRAILLVGFPLLIAVLAVVAWRVVGAALRPVEALRQGAEEITGGGGPGRLPVPESRDEIHRLAVTLNDMLDRIAAVRARQRDFTADAAHELRSPLANMRTQLEVAQRLGDRTDWPAVADDLLTDTERLIRLAEDLLLLARADNPVAAEAAQRTAHPIDLGELLAEVAARYPAPPVLPLASAEPCRVLGDPDALRRVVANLLDNAVRHTRSRVELAVAVDGPDAVISVTDDGPGIPAADRERVFERFTRLDDGRARDAGGAGLGLAIVGELVRRHGGTVRLADAGPGLRAEIRLPHVPAPTSPDNPAPTSPDNPVPTSPDVATRVES